MKRFLVAAGLLAALHAPPCSADVVPQRAVEAAETWLALVDAGRTREAVETCCDGDAADRKRMIARLAHDQQGAKPLKPKSRTIRSWTGHGDGDTSRMAPGAYFSLVFDTMPPSGAPLVEEVRLVPLGDGDWRVVDYVRGTPSARHDP